MTKKDSCSLATKCSHDHGHHDSHSIGEEERANLIKDLFGAYFSGETKNIQYSKKTAELKLLTDGNTATVNLKTMVCIHEWFSNSHILIYLKENQIRL